MEQILKLWLIVYFSAIVIVIGDRSVVVVVGDGYTFVDLERLSIRPATTINPSFRRSSAHINSGVRATPLPGFMTRVVVCRSDGDRPRTRLKPCDCERERWTCVCVCGIVTSIRREWWASSSSCSVLFCIYRLYLSLCGHNTECAQDSPFSFSIHHIF